MMIMMILIINITLVFFYLNNVLSWSDSIGIKALTCTIQQVSA